MDTKLYILTGNIVSRESEAYRIRYVLFRKYSSLYGDDCIRDTPVPIPNTEVKPYNADGTARETLW